MTPHTTPELRKKFENYIKTLNMLNDKGISKEAIPLLLRFFDQEISQELSTLEQKHAAELEQAVEAERERIFSEIEHRLDERPKKKRETFYNLGHNAEVTGWNKCLWRVKNICKLLDSNGKSLTKGEA